MNRLTLDEYAHHKLRALERRGLKRELVTIDRTGGVVVECGGEKLVSFSCNDYLGLASDPATIKASNAATSRLGTGAGASRLITGSHSGYVELERRLAKLKAAEDAVVFGSGYLASLGTLPLMAGKSDLVVIDSLAHSCLLSGARLSGAQVRSFAHNDIDSLEELLATERQHYRHCVIVTEGVFSMDGDLAPLPDIAAMADRFDAWLLSDDAHGLGVVGNGRGSGFAHPEITNVPLQMGTLSKAVGAYGGYLCATGAVCDLIRTRARSFVYSTGLPPGTVAAASTALDIIASDAQRIARPLALARQFTDSLGLPSAQSAIVPLVFGDTEATVAASRRLRQTGFFVAAIRPPTVPAGTARLRFTFSAAHADSDVAGLIDAVASLKRSVPACDTPATSQ